MHSPAPSLASSIIRHIRTFAAAIKPSEKRLMEIYRSTHLHFVLRFCAWDGREWNQVNLSSDRRISGECSPGTTFWPERLSSSVPSPVPLAQPMPSISACESASRAPPPEFAWTTCAAFFASAAFDSDTDARCGGRSERLGREKRHLEFNGRAKKQL